MPARTSPRHGRNPSERATVQLGTFSGADDADQAVDVEHPPCMVSADSARLRRESEALAIAPDVPAELHETLPARFS